ncbi:YdeI/OmpD-associated family protein [Agrococcus versicolor]|uniref:YdeI/OmpD-associated family protein n=1 Tax=Agrococcus versicolor TaxID=501482 RepID=A0ABN3AJ23_9MICO
MTQPGTPGGSAERPAVFFRDAAELRAWFEANHETAAELWMGLHKRSSPASDPGLGWADAVPEALCFGWIDSVSQPIDEHTRRQRWTPRKAASTWSAVNVAHVERLLAEGRMHPAGIAAYERRTPERTGTYSHEQEAIAIGPSEQAVLDASPAATAFLAAATPSYRKAALHWVASAKREETRARRATLLVEACETGALLPHLRPAPTPRWLERAAAAADAARTTTGDRAGLAVSDRAGRSQRPSQTRSR